MRFKCPLVSLKYIQSTGVVVLVTLCELDSLEGPGIVMYFLEINLSSDLIKWNFPDRQTFIPLSRVYGIQEITCTTAKTVSLNVQYTVVKDNV